MRATRRDFLIGTGLIAAAAPFPALGAGQAEAALLRRVLGAGHPRRDDEDVRRRRSKTTSPSKAITAAPCSSRAPSWSRCSAAISRWATSRRRTSRSRFRPGRSLTSAYLFRDAAHLKTFFDSESGAEMKKMAEDQLGIHILGPTYFGTRQVGLKPDKKINTPADMAGIKLRMPGGDAWQFLGTALGANPTPMAYAEVYTGLQTGAIDGQDNPLPNVENMKFYEVMSQIVLTSHLVGFDILTVSAKVWNAHVGRPAGEVPGRRRQGHRLEHREAPGAREGAGRPLQGARASTSTRPTSRPSASMRRRSTWPPTLPRTGRRVWSRRSTRSEASRRAPSAGDARRSRWRDGCDAVEREKRRDSSAAGPRRMVLPARRERPRRDAGGHVRRLHHPDRLPLSRSTSRSAGPRSSPSSCGSGSCCGAPPSSSARARRSASTSSTRRRGPQARRIMCIVTGRRADRALRRLAAGGRRLRHLHEGREQRLSQDPLRPAVLDLRRLRGRRHRPLSLAVLAGDAGQGAGGLRSDQGGLGRMNLASPFSIAIVAITALAPARPADRPRDDRRLDPLSAARRAGHGHRRRAAAERHVHQLHHPGGAAVHPGGRADEYRHA